MLKPAQCDSVFFCSTVCVTKGKPYLGQRDIVIKQICALSDCVFIVGSLKIKPLVICLLALRCS